MLTIWLRFCWLIPPPPPPDGAATGADVPETGAFATPFTRGAEVGVANGPFGPVLALLGPGLGAVCPDIVAALSCTG